MKNEDALIVKTHGGSKMTKSKPSQDRLMEINDEDVIFHVEGYCEEINERAKDCAHKRIHQTTPIIFSNAWANIGTVRLPCFSYSHT